MLNDLERLLAITERFKPLLTCEELKEWQRISAETADKRAELMAAHEALDGHMLVLSADGPQLLVEDGKTLFLGREWDVTVRRDLVPGKTIYYFSDLYGSLPPTSSKPSLTFAELREANRGRNYIDSDDMFGQIMAHVAKAWRVRTAAASLANLAEAVADIDLLAQTVSHDLEGAVRTLLESRKIKKQPFAPPAKPYKSPPVYEPHTHEHLRNEPEEFKPAVIDPAAGFSQPTVPLAPSAEPSIEWCGRCGSYHVRPRDEAHRAELQCRQTLAEWAAEPPAGNIVD